MDDAGSMQALVRSTVYSIVHPISEHMKELQAQVQQLAKRLKETSDRHEESRLCIERQHEELLNQRKSISNHHNDLEKLRNDLGTTHREKDKLGDDHESTKTDLAKVAADLRTTNALLKVLQQRSDDFDGDIRSLHAGATSTGKLIAEEAERSAQIRELAQSLNGRHFELAKEVGELAQSTAATNTGLHKLTQHCEKTNGALCSELAQHQEHLDSLDGRLVPTQHDIQGHAEAIRSIEEKLRLMKPFLDSSSSFGGGADDSSASRSPGGERAETTMKASADVENQKAALNRLSDLFNAYKDESLQLLKDLDRRAGDNTQRLEGLQAAKESMTEHLRKHDGFLSKLQQTLDAVGGQVDMLQADFKGMSTSQTDLAKRVEGQRITLAKTQADLKNTNARLDGADESLLRLKDGLSMTDATVAKLGSRYDSCSRNLNGVGRGLADVGKHVHQGDHGMLAPKPFNVADAGKPLSHQGELALPPPRSPDTSRALHMVGDLSPLPPPVSPHARRLQSLHLRPGVSLEGGTPSSAC